MSQGDGISRVEHPAYRRQRITDAARLLPVIGFFLFILPVLATSGSDSVTTAGGFVFVFSIWGILIVASALLSLWLGRDDGGDTGNPHG